MHRIVVDAMGGDHAPLEIVKGAGEASLASGNAEIILVGDSAELGRILPTIRHDGGRIRVHHAPTAIGMDEKPSEALAAKPDSSIAVAVDLVARGEGDALVSAGNTGASVLACARRWKLISGVKRSGLATVYPTELRRGANNDPFSLILDVGATIEASADDLVAFALMGSAYARVISRNPRPRVALLSNGSEAGKGPKEVVAAHELLLKATELNFIGNVEVKMLEGVSQTIVSLARYAYKEKLLWRAALAMLSSGIQRLKLLTDWEQYGGAPLLGFDNLFIKAHGRSKARALSNAIRVAEKAVSANLCENIANSLAHFEERVGDRTSAG